MKKELSFFVWNINIDNNLENYSQDSNLFCFFFLWLISYHFMIFFFWRLLVESLANKLQIKNHDEKMYVNLIVSSASFGYFWKNCDHRARLVRGILSAHPLFGARAPPSTPPDFCLLLQGENICQLGLLSVTNYMFISSKLNESW